MEKVFRRGGKPMFMGEFSCKVDNKGRFMLPVKFREIIENSEVVITRGFENSISIYPINVWEEEIIEKQIKQLKLTNKNHRAYQRFILSAAVKLPLDSQGRINIPSSLLEHSGIKKNAVVMGNVSHIEIWSEENWKQYIEKTSDEIEELVDEIEF